MELAKHLNNGISCQINSPTLIFTKRERDILIKHLEIGENKSRAINITRKLQKSTCMLRLTTPEFQQLMAYLPSSNKRIGTTFFNWLRSFIARLV
jgi:hypothetical protein